jgi:hypothetical protein
MSPGSPYVVPLGCDCFPRYGATQFRLKARKKDGEPTLPLDFGIWPFAMVKSLIENDFEGMADSRNLMLRRETFGNLILCDRRFPAGSYNHEMPPVTESDFTANNFQLFVDRYNRRIASFRDRLARSDKVLLFMTATNLLPLHLDNACTIDDLKSIPRALRARYPGTQFRFLVMVEHVRRIVPDWWDGELYVINIPLIGPYTLFLPYILFCLGLRKVFPEILASYTSEPRQSRARSLAGRPGS